MTYRLRYNRRFVHMLELLPGDVRAQARRVIQDLTNQPYPLSAKELDGHPGYWRIWLLRNHRLIWHVLEEEQSVNLLYVGPKPPDLYQRLGLGKHLRETEEALAYEVEFDRDEAISAEGMQDSAPASAVTGQET